MSPQATSPASFPLREHVPLAPYTTFGIGGPARWFASVTTEAELAAACAWAAARQLPVFLLGGGSNILVADEGYPGLVLHIALRGLRQSDHGGHRLFTAAAGEDWDALVDQSLAANCAGMECLAGIPGTVGGTPVQNVGAYGQEVAQTIATVRCYDRQAAVFVTFTNRECGFAYRASRFNTGADRGRYIVTEVVFALTPGAAPLLAYADLRTYFAGHPGAPTLAETAAAVRAIRRRKGMVVDPGPLAARDPDTRSAGSFFKNPIIPDSLYTELAAAWIAQSSTPANAALPSYPAPPAPDGTPQRKLPAAWLLEQAGFPKGFALADAAISSRHTLALTNHSGQATAADILALRDTLIRGVQNRFHITLEPEPIWVG